MAFAGGVLLGRLDHGCTPLVVQLPAAGHSTGGKGSSKGDCGEGDLGGCLAQFRRVLEDSSDSMGQVDQDAPHSQAHKAQWWKVGACPWPRRSLKFSRPTVDRVAMQPRTHCRPLKPHSCMYSC